MKKILFGLFSSLLLITSASLKTVNVSASTNSHERRNEGVRIVSYNFKDEIIEEKDYDSGFGRTILKQGRKVTIVYNDDSQEDDKFYPQSFRREAKRPIGENPYNVGLVDFIEKIGGMQYNCKAVSIGSFYSFLTFLKDGNYLKESEKYECLTQDEMDEWMYKYRLSNNCLTPEDQQKIEEERLRQEQLELEKELEKQRYIESYIERYKESCTDSKVPEVIEKEVLQIENSLLPYEIFDKEGYIAKRTGSLLRYGEGFAFYNLKGDALRESITIDKGKLVIYLKDYAISKKDWFKEEITSLNNESFKESLKKFFEEIKNVFADLFS